MKYLCLVYIEEKKLDAMSKNELDVLIDESVAYDEVLRKSGHYLVSEALQPVQTAATVRVRNGKASIRDLNDAIQVASKIPPARLGSVEVRPILEPEQQ